MEGGKKIYIMIDNDMNRAEADDKEAATIQYFLCTSTYPQFTLNDAPKVISSTGQ